MEPMRGVANRENSGDPVFAGLQRRMRENGTTVST